VALESPPSPIRSEAAIATTGASVIFGSLWNSLSQTLPQLFSLIISVAAARFLGPNGMGRQSFIAFTMISLTQVVSEGLKESLMRSVGEARGAGRLAAIRRLVRWALRVQLAGGLAGAAILLIAGLLGADPQAAWLLAAVECLMLTLQGVPWAVLAGSQRWRQASMVGLMVGAVGVPVTIAVLAAGGGIVGMFAVEAVFSGVGLVGVTVLSRGTLSALPKGAEPAPDLLGRTRRYAVLATLMTLLTFVVWQRSEFFFLRAYSTDHEIAFYSIAFAAANGMALIPGALANTLSPAFATLHGARDHGRIGSGYWRAQRLLLIISLPLLAGFAALGPALIRLAYGAAYKPAGPVLLILLSLFPLIPLLAVANSLLVGLGALRVALIWEAIGGVVTIGLNFLLVPHHAAIGAALADIGGQIAVVVPVLIYANRLAGPRALDWAAIARVAIVSAAAGLAAWAIDTLLGGVGGLLLGSLAGLAVFLPLASLVRVVPARDERWVAEILAERLGAGATRFVSRLLVPPRPRRASRTVPRARPLHADGPRDADATPASGEDAERPFRLLAYSDATRRGGAELALGYLLSELDASIEVTVVGVEPGIVSWISAWRSGAVEVILPRARRKWQLGSIFAHIRAVHRLKPDILHASLNSPWSCQYGQLAGLLTPRTRVVAVENAPVRSSSHLQRALKRALSRGLAAHVAVGRKSAYEIERLIGLRPGSLMAIPNGVPDDALSIRTVPATSTAPVIGMISRIDELKGVDLLVRALAMLPDALAVVVGEGPALADVRTLAEQFGVSKRLHTPGFEFDARARLPDFDIFVLPSRMEALPLSILEAMFARLPVIASDIGSVSEAVLDGETGLLIPVDDLAALVAALLRLLEDAPLREQMGARAREVALERFSAATMARSYEELYSRVTHAGVRKSRRRS
jgi:glycosyltransferase involved in cell wall biosynthesis/O-antigen/teichoic acid export membrane protein